MSVRAAIDAGAFADLREILAASPRLVNELVEWGEHRQLRTHPLHYVCDKRFDGTITKEAALLLVEELIVAGANVNDHAKDREPPLHGAASLGAEDVGLRLLDAGAIPGALGMFRETALHWASSLGLDRLAFRLIDAGADVNLEDVRFGASALGWALHGRANSPPANQGRQVEVIALLVESGATVTTGQLVSATLRADWKLLAALRAQVRNRH